MYWTGERMHWMLFVGSAPLHGRQKQRDAKTCARRRRPGQHIARLSESDTLQREGPLWLRLAEVAGAETSSSLLEGYAESRSDALRADVLKRSKGDGFFLLEAFASGEEAQRLPQDEEFHLLTPKFVSRALFPGVRAWGESGRSKTKDGSSDDEEQGQEDRSTPEMILERLGVSSVHLIIGTVQAADKWDAEELAKLCTAEAKRAVESGEALRAVALPADDGLGFILLLAYPSGSEFALFDTSLGDEYSNENGWRLETLSSVYPQASAWALPADVLAEAWDLPELEPFRPRQTQQQDTSESGATGSGHFDPVRVWLGFGALEKAQQHLRLPGPTPLAVSGFNQARLDPLLYGLESEDDSGVSIDLPGLVCGEQNGATGDKIREGLAMLQRAGKTAVVGYGSGQVMDTARAVAALGAVSPQEAERVLGRAQRVAEESRGIGFLRASTGASPLPLTLVTTGVGAEAAYTSTSILRFGNVRTLVEWDPSNERIVVSDPRILRRLPPALLEIAARVSLGCCIEALLAEARSTTSDRLAFEGLGMAVRVLMTKEWDREDDDEAFRELSTASMMAGSAREATGLGLAATLALVFEAADKVPPKDGAAQALDSSHGSSFARAYLRILPCVVDSGLADDDSISAVAQVVTEPATSTQLASFLHRQALKAPAPRPVSRSTARQIAESVCLAPMRGYPARPAPLLLERILERAELIAS